MSNSVKASRTRGRVMIEGPLRVGSNVLLSGDTMRGDVVLVKRVPVSADGFYPFRLPTCNIMNITFNQEVACQSTGATLGIGTSADDTKYAAHGLSAKGFYQLTVSAPNLLAVASGTTFQANVTSVGTAGTQVGSLYITYVQVGDTTD